MALAIVEAVLRNQHTLMTVASPLRGLYDVANIAHSVPALVGRSGIEQVLNLPMSEDEFAVFQQSAQTCKDALARAG